MVDLIHEILNDHLIIIEIKNGQTLKVIPQSDLSCLADKINNAMEKEYNNG